MLVGEESGGDSPEVLNDALAYWAESRAKREMYDGLGSPDQQRMYREDEERDARAVLEAYNSVPEEDLCASQADVREGWEKIDAVRQQIAEKVGTLESLQGWFTTLRNEAEDTAEGLGTLVGQLRELLEEV